MNAEQQVPGHTGALRPPSSFWTFLGSLPSRIGRPVAGAAYIPQLDGLRFLAIASVLVWHASLRAVRFSEGGSGLAGDLITWLPHGEMGVALFFFISGFVIAQPFIKGAQRGVWPSTADFFQRRLIRIVPPCAIVMLGCFGLLVFAGQVPNAPGFQGKEVPLVQSLAASLLYVHGVLFNATPRLNPPTWSLEIEMQFYLLSPLLVWGYLRVARPDRRMLLGVAILVLSMAAAIWAQTVFGEWSRQRWTLLKFFHLFWTGILVADAASRRDPLREPASGTFDLVFLAGLAVLWVGGLFRDGAAPPTDPLVVATSTLAAVAVYQGGMRGRIARRFLGLPAIALVGTMCYSIYLVHVPVMHITAVMLARTVPLRDGVATVLGMPALLILVSMLAGLAYYLTVERFFMLLARGRPRQSDAAPSSRMAPEKPPAP